MIKVKADYILAAAALATFIILALYLLMQDSSVVGPI